MYRPPPKFPMPTRKRTRPKPDPTADWRLIRTDPVVFTQLIKKFGVKGALVEELWTLEDSIFENLRPVHGLIFLFKFLQNNGPPQPIATDKRSSKIYFAKQVIREGCASQAVISLLLNCSHPDIVLGPELTKLKEFSMCFDAMMRGLILANSQAIKNAHNSMAPHLFQFDATPPKKNDDSYHFITYMPIDGHLYELDGLREGPIHHGAVSSEQDWLDVVRPIIMKRISVYTEGKIFFNLMAVVTDKKAIYERQMEELIAETQMISIQSADVGIEIQRLRLLIQYEDAKSEQYKQEMMRRRHNYLPFLVAFVKVLSEEKKLMPLYEKAKERALRKTAKKIKV